MDAKFRKDKDTLVVTGTGVIAFGAWTVLKGAMILFNSRDTFLQQIEGITPEEQDFYMTLVWIIFGFFMFIILALNLYVGLAAKAEGKGKKKRRYRILAILMLFFQVFMSSLGVVDAFSGELDEEILVSTLMDILGIFMLWDLVTASFRVKRRMKEEGLVFEYTKKKKVG